MAASGTGNLIFIDGILDKYKYLNILKNNLKESARKLGLLEDFHFQQDNDPKHTARIVKEWIIYNTPHMLITPPQSPDVNPIENLWAEIGKRLNKFQITSKQILKNKIIETWNSIECSFTKSLVYSMERRLRDIIAAKGGPTKY
ncbi:Transposable element Tcb1 transposase [Anthophora quadrimaculata]